MGKQQASDILPFDLKMLMLRVLKYNSLNLNLKS